MKNLTLLFVIFLFPISLLADESQWKQFVQEETFLIAHADFNKIDVAATIKNNQPLVETVLRALHSEVNVQAIMAIADSGKKYLTETLGIQEAYVVLNVQMPSFFTVILPQTGKIKIETIRSILAPLEPESWLEVTPSTDNKYVLIFLRLGKIDEEERRQLMMRHFPPTSVDRPEFAEAFKAVENAPIQIVSAIPDFAKKVIKETAPKLPPPFDTLDIVTPFTELRWKAVGIDPATTTLDVTVTMTTDVAAETVLKNVRQAVPMIVEKGFEMDVSPPRYDSAVRLWHFRRTLKALLPLLQIQTLPPLQRNDAALTLHWEKPQFEKMTEAMVPILNVFAADASVRLERNVCAGKMKSLLLACHNYHDTNGHFPPPFSLDKTGKPLHSWRVLLLPYLEQQALYKQIRLDEPWDSTHNKQFHDKMPIVFRCHACTKGNAARDTSFCMVIGKDTIGSPDGKFTTLRGITDGTAYTILLVERKEPVCWMEPIDVLQEEAYLGANKSAGGIGSEHRGGAVVGFADGSSRFLFEDADLKKLKAVLTPAGGEWVEYGEVVEFIR